MLQKEQVSNATYLLNKGPFKYHIQEQTKLAYKAYYIHNFILSSIS